MEDKIVDKVVSFIVWFADNYYRFGLGGYVALAVIARVLKDKEGLKA